MKDFWKILNNNLGYIFVTGHPIIEFKYLINSMTSDYLHFVPAIDDTIALGLASGAFISGFKSCVLLMESNFDFIFYQYKKINNVMGIPIIFISTDGDNPFNLKKFNLEDLSGLNNFVYKENNSAIILVD